LKLVRVAQLQRRTRVFFERPPQLHRFRVRERFRGRFRVRNADLAIAPYPNTQADLPPPALTSLRSRIVLKYCMTPERWRQVEALYHAVLEQPPDRRAPFLAAACGDDQPLHREVADLLAETPEQETGETRTVLLPGADLGPYHIVSRLGEGGMGMVYRGVDTRLGRPVAIKISAGQFNKRFEWEARAISALNHPNICTLYDVGSLPSGGGYMVTELVEGETLREWLKRGPAFDGCLNIIRQTIAALTAAHDAGIVHRDLKPANIMVRFDGYVKVLDFGLAKRIVSRASASSDTSSGMSTPGQILGTIAYMSPEQILGQEVDARSDLFALGIILYEMAAGKHPWPRTSSIDAMHATLRDDPPPIGGTLDPVILRCLAKQPCDRFATAAELQAALDQACVEPLARRSVRVPSVAVLPFANLSADPENGFFCDGLTEEIIHALARESGLKVAGRTSSFFFRGKDLDFAAIASKLNVEHILEGSVRKSGNRIRVTVQLIKVADGFPLWSERFDREMTDIFAIQDEITHGIHEVLRIKLSAEPQAPRHEPNLRAYEAYLTARTQWFKGTLESQVRFKEAVDRAIALDPRFALPYMLLGGHYSMIAHRGSAAALEVIPLAQAAEEEALRLDPSLPEAHALLGVWAGVFSFDWKEAQRRFRLAMAREPVAPDIHLWYGNHYLLPLGRTAEALEEIARGVEADPLNLLYRHIWARALRHSGRLKEAEAEWRKVLDLEENFPSALESLGQTCAHQGRIEEALALTGKAYALMPWSNMLAGQLAAVLMLSRQRDRAQELLAKLRDSSEYGCPTGMTLFHALCGEHGRAAEWAEKAIEERHPEFIKTLGPLLRTTPGWPALAKKMNLPG